MRLALWRLPHNMRLARWRLPHHMRLVHWRLPHHMHNATDAEATLRPLTTQPPEATPWPLTLCEFLSMMRCMLI